MVRQIVRRPTTDGKYYVEAAGLSTDPKPTLMLITGSRFLEADTGACYLFNETGSAWNENQQLTEAVAAYLDDHPEALDQAAIEAMFGDQLDDIETDVGVLKSALIHLSRQKKSRIIPALFPAFRPAPSSSDPPAGIRTGGRSCRSWWL